MRIRKKKQPVRRLQEQKGKSAAKIERKPPKQNPMFRGLPFLHPEGAASGRSCRFQNISGSQIPGVAEVRVFPSSADWAGPAFVRVSLFCVLEEVVLVPSVREKVLVS